MRLTINGEQVSYSLEDERTLGEVVRGVQGWLAGAGFHVTRVTADGRELPVENARDWGSIDVTSCGELHVSATHTGEMKVEHWKTLGTWLRMLQDELGPEAAGPAANPAALAELLSDLPGTLEGMRANPFASPGSPAVARFEAAFSGADAAAVAAWPPERKREAAGLIAELRGQLDRRLADCAAPQEALKRCAAQVRDSMGRLPEVSVLLQTGRDRPAMEIVIQFSDVVQSLLALLPFLPPDAERAKLLGELTPFLRDLVAAFDAKDSVLIGDLLEYEITPRIARLAPVLEKAG